MKKRQQLFLQLRFQIDQQIAANQQVEFRERRIHDHILGRKDHRFTDLP